MGHSEMLLAVAGLDDEQVRKLTAMLARGEWSAFSKEDQVAFRFTHKLTGKPASITDADVKELIAAYGRHRAMDIIWYVSWCNYMTRVGDGLQLPLESTNVFGPAPKKEKP